MIAQLSAQNNRENLEALQRELAAVEQRRQENVAGQANEAQQRRAVAANRIHNLNLQR
jgi:hypothetical protein